MIPSRRLQRAGAASREGGEKRKAKKESALGGLTPTPTTTTPTHHHHSPSTVLSLALLCFFALSFVPGASASVVLTVSVAEKESHGSRQLGRDENLESPWLWCSHHQHRFFTLDLELTLSLSLFPFPSVSSPAPHLLSTAPSPQKKTKKTHQQQNGNVTFDAIQDMPADFGPRLPPAGLAGLLVVANPLVACAPRGGGGLLPPPPDAVPAGASWIALIERSPPPTPNNGDGEDDGGAATGKGRLLSSRAGEREREREQALMRGFGENDGGDYEALSGLLGALLGGVGVSGGAGAGTRAGRGRFVLATDEDTTTTTAAEEKAAAADPRSSSSSPPATPPAAPRSPPCSFDAKVRAAAAAGASAAIIFDDAPGQPLVIMAKAGGAPEPTIPAVFISAEGAF